MTLESLRNAKNKGELLELVLADALGDAGFVNIRRQHSGSQRGFDLSAERVSSVDGRMEVWVFECKNLSKRITLADIAPKLIWHYGRTPIDRFVIVGPSTISNDLDQMLRDHQYSIQIGIWTDGNLERLIEGSPSARKRLGIASVDNESPVSIDDFPCYPSNSISFHIAHQLNPPFEFDYITTEDSIVKAVSDFERRLIATIANPTRASLRIHSFCVDTLDYSRVEGRVVRLMKQKGVFTPIELSFTPSRNVGGRSDILEGQVWQVDAGASETIALVLSKNSLPGLYQVAFRIDGTLDGKDVTRLSPSFAIHIQEKDVDLVRFYVLGRHYDSPASQLLRVNASIWNRLKLAAGDPSKMVFLGPTFREVMLNQVDKTWMVRACPLNLQPDGSGLISPSDRTLVIFDLKTKVDEEVFSVDKTMSSLTGTDKWSEYVRRTVETK